MENTLKNAINELSRYYEEFKDLNLEIKHSNETKIENGILYFNQVNKALLCLVNYINGRSVEISDHFETFGTMIDLSRNAVYTLQYMKSTIRKKALMGVNSIMLYTEDTYEVKDEPYFGYMRGRYTKEEIKEIVRYAKIFDIEVIPCIQTLGHMEQYLKWVSSHNIKDNDRVLMVDLPETYTFIEKLISSVSEMYETSKIHIGMDEAQGLGLGKYLKKNGYKEQFEIFSRHLNQVVEICQKHGFEDIMIWSDMYFRMASIRDEYYDFNVTFTDEVKNSIPENVQLVYWDYYQTGKEQYDNMINKHKDFRKEIIMASGIWTWTKLVYDKKLTENRALKSIQSCIDNNINSIYFTMWGDDGAYCDMDSSLLGVFDMANYSFVQDKMDKVVFNYITKYDYDLFNTLSDLNESPICPVALLWDDPLLGIYLNNEMIKDDNILNTTKDFLTEYSEKLKKTQNHCFSSKHTYLLSEVLKYKLLVRKELLDCYFNKKSMTNVIELCEEAVHWTKELTESFRTMWMSRYKPFGFEVIQSRLATIMIRLEETKRRVYEYENKETSNIIELEEKAKHSQYIYERHELIAYSSYSKLVG
ncbi:family 20 glycosylhydrolase [Mycoplasmatota bacterium]|nr:family 20 glycosylhydrolase [Mycoplasmatota bacterium]